jgi:hypothetical protein
MKRDKFLVLVLLLFGPSCFPQSPPAATEKRKQSPVFSIDVAPPDDPVKLDAPILISVTVTNISGKEANWASERGAEGKYTEFRYLLMKDGREVGTALFHRVITGKLRPDDPVEIWTGSTILLTHPPGVMFKFKIDLKRLYEIKESGVYTVEARLFDDYSKTIVHSNILMLKVTSP